jgi:hypothetical protein
MTSRTTPLPATEPVTSRPWWQLGLAAAIGAAAINVVIFYLYQLVTGAAIRVVPPGDVLQDLPVAMVVIMSVIPPLVAGLLAYALHRWIRSAAVWFTVISVVLVALSLFSPWTQPTEIATSAKLTLSVMHLVVAGATLAAYLPRLAATRD